MEPIREVESAFVAAGIKYRHIDLVRYDEKIFGNFIVDVSVGDITLRITKDRGQFFVEIKNGCRSAEGTLQEAFPSTKLGDILSILSGKI